MASNDRRILITGIAGQLGGKLAARLEADDRVAAVTGVDLREPAHDLGRTEFVRADLRSPLIARVLESTRTDTVVHLAITALPSEAGGRASMKDHNVIGTMQLLGAAQRSDRLRRFVMKSTTAVYGSSYDDPAMFGEEVNPQPSGRSGYARDAVEVESYARAFGRRRVDVLLTILRFANFIGPTVDSPLTRYFSLPVVPTVFGFDPRLQLCHEDDAVEVLRRSVLEEHPGIYNVAGPGVVYLSQALRLAGKPGVPVPVPFVNGLAAALRRAGRVDFSPEQLRLLQFGRVADITRLRERFGYRPEHSTRAAFEDFLASRRAAGPFDRDAAVRLEHQLHDLLTRGGPTGGTGERMGGSLGQVRR